MIDLTTDNPDSIAWQQARTTEAVEVLHGLPGFAPLQDAALRYADAGKRWTPVRAGNRVFQRRQDTGAELPVLTVRDGVGAEPRVLVDFNDHLVAGGPRVSLAWVSPSPDGSVVAYAVAEEGTEVNKVFLVDVASGDALTDEVPWNVAFAPSWLPDSSGFWCSTREITAIAVTMPIRRFILGEPASDWSPELPATLMFPRPEVSKDGHYVAIATGNTEMRVDCLITKDLQVVPFLEGVPGAFRGLIRDDAFYALTDNDAPHSRIVRIPLDTSADESTWTEVLPESQDVLADFDIVGDKLVVASMRECSIAIDVVDLATGARTAVPLPEHGAAGAELARVVYPMLPIFVRGTDEISFVFSSLTSSPAIYRYLLDENRLECVEPPAVTLEGMTVSYLIGVSADGTEIPAHVLHRADLDLSQPHPTFLWGYGGFHLAELPAYPGGQAAWVEAGGVLVLAHLRGGCEFGAEWWRSGRRERKQNTFNDLYAVAEKLIEVGLTSSEKLAIYGGSNGGLLTAVAVTQRPDLWAAVVSDVPATDLLNMQREPLLYAICREEYGDALIPSERPWLEAIDPIANAQPADYPATLVIAGANDPRCPASQARLFADALSTAQTGDAPILLRVHADQGHGAQGAKESADRLAEILAFCAEHTGLALGR